MPIRDQLAESVSRALARVAADRSLDLEVTPAEVLLERPARREHGDWSTDIGASSSMVVPTSSRKLTT